VKSTSSFVARGGKIVMVGMSPDPVFPYDFGKLMYKEASIDTLFRYRNCYPAAIQAVASGLPVSKIVSHKFRFADSAEAFRQNSENRAEVVKAVIEF
jgi:L-iditol 2-dehydrogenase